MGEPFKNLFNIDSVSEISTCIKQVYDQFDEINFGKKVFGKSWNTLELKDRMHHIADCLHDFLPGNYRKAVRILIKSGQNKKGFVYMVYCDFVEKFGLDSPDDSIAALEEFTKLCSAEFAVRPFIIKYPEKMFDVLKTWARSGNVDVRRLASEGCRPILPWAMDIPALRKDPSPILPVLEILKNDDSLYVRKSVANNLNAITKDNEKIVLQIAKKWKSENPDTSWILKHGLRTLLKKGNPEALALFEYKQDKNLELKNFVLDKKIGKNGILKFSFRIQSDKVLGKTRIEYKLTMPKLNNKTTSKVFMIMDKISESNFLDIKSKHDFRPVTTRKYYPGSYALEIIVNGHPVGTGSFVMQE